MKRPDRSITKCLIGAKFGWTAEDPLAENHEVMETWIGHDSSMKALLLNKNRSTFILHAVKTMSLKWKTTIEIEFQSNGKKYYRGADIVFHGVLRNCDGHYQQTIEELFEVANMSHYVTCRMTAEILGQDGIKESDFKEKPVDQCGKRA